GALAVVLRSRGLLAWRWGVELEPGLATAPIPFGALLGVFLLGTLTKRAGENESFAATLAGLALMTWVRFGTSIAWTWYVLIGTTVTFVVGYGASLWRRGKESYS